MQSQILDSASGLISFAVYFFGAAALFILFTVIYLRITPYKEIHEIRDKKKTAPALSFAGAILGFCLPMASAIIHSVSFIDMMIWSFIAMIVQICVFIVIRRVFPKMIIAIEKDSAGAAVFVASLSLAAGIINAASMSY